MAALLLRSDAQLELRFELRFEALRYAFRVWCDAKGGCDQRHPSSPQCPSSRPNYRGGSSCVGGRVCGRQVGYCLQRHEV